MSYTNRRTGTPFDQLMRLRKARPRRRPERAPTPQPDPVEAPRLRVIDLEQCASALRAGNEVRDEAAAFRREIRTMGRAPALARLARLFTRLPEWAVGIDVHVLLEMSPGVGPVLADKIQTSVGLFRAVAAGELADTERHGLIGALWCQADRFEEADEEAQAA